MNNEKSVKTILLVEDEAVIAVAEMMNIKKLGYDVITANTGEKAVLLASGDSRIDLILMDMDLGSGIDGSEAAIQILALRIIPIVFLTSHSEREMVERVRNITRYGYVVKSSGDFVLQSSIEMAFELFEKQKHIHVSEEHYRNLFENMLNAFAYCKMVFDDNAQPVDFIYLTVNNSFKELTGLGDVEGKYVTEVIPGIRELNPDLFNIYGRVALTGKPERFEMFYKPLGKWRSVLASSTEKGYFTAVFDDFTERKNTEVRLENIITGTDIGTWEWNVQTGETVFNERWAEIVGYTIDELQPVSIETWKKLAHPDDLEKSNELLQKHFFGELEFYSFDSRMKHKDGSWVWVSDRGKVIDRDENGNPLKMFGTHTDITRRKLLEEALNNTIEKYRQLFEAESDSVFLIDDETGQIYEANTSAINTYGYSHEELLTKCNTDISAEPEYTRKATLDRANHIPVRWHKKKDGTVFPVEINASHLVWNQRPVHIAAIRDITLRKNADDKIRALLAEKELLLKEVHNSVKDNMNTIYSLLTLQSHAFTEPSAVTALNDTKNRVNSMRTLYEKLARSEDYRNLSIKDYLLPLIEETVAAFPDFMKVQTEIIIEDFLIGTKILFPIGLIVSELVVNVIKYAFKDIDNGILRVSVSHAGSHVTLFVQDNGIGLPLSINFWSSSSNLGLNTIGMLAEQIGGSIRIERVDGTKIVLEFDI